MKKTHFIGMAGLHGCLPQTCDVYESRAAAADSLADIHDLGPHSRIRRELKSTGYVDLDLHKHGNEYAEITECECDNPSQHSDSGGYDE